MTGWFALVRLELRTDLRDPTRWLSLLLFLGAFFAPPWAARFESAIADVKLDQPIAPIPYVRRPSCLPEEVPPVRLDPEGAPWPAALPWPEPFAADAAVTVTVEATEPPTVRVRSADARGAAVVRACVRRNLEQARRDRAEAAGLAADPNHLVDVTWVPPRALALGPSRASVFGASLAMLAVTLSGAAAIEAVPRRRASGLFEQLRATPTGPLALVSAWLLVIVGWCMLSAGVFAAAWAVGARGAIRGDLLVHVPPLAAAVAAASIRSSLEARDAQSAAFRWSWVLAAIGATTIAAVFTLPHPALAALVPLGGSVLACAGVLGAWAGLADIAALAWTALGLWWTARSLEQEGSATAGVAPALLRHARGDYGPEVLLLGLMGASAGVLNGFGFATGSLVAWTAAGFGGLMIAPALLAPSVLALPRRELLPLGWPREGWLVVPAVLGLGAAAPVVMAAATAWLPVGPDLEALAAMFAEQESPWMPLVAAVAPAVAEELLFRGAILGLLLRGQRPWVAVVVQAVLFGLAHASLVRMPWTVLVGLVLGGLRLRTGSLWPGVVVHLVLNAVVWAAAG